MQEVCPCHGEPWYVRRRAEDGRPRRECHVKLLVSHRAREYKRYHHGEGREKQSIRRINVTIDKLERELEELRKGVQNVRQD